LYKLLRATKEASSPPSLMLHGLKMASYSGGKVETSGGGAFAAAVLDTTS